MSSDTWILVADGSRAQLYRQGGNEGRDWSLLQEFYHPAAREMGRDIAGNRPNQIQHAMETTSKGDEGGHGVQEYESQRFSRELCEYLHSAAMRNQFGTLVIVAPPKFLGALRKNMTKPVEERVSHYVAKDYTNKQPRELAPIMAGL
ncbi:MAG: host attachment protein [Myxococcaceae bacterium]|nr:host attachment protein [Myxococcaceae bacterium]MCI0671069.1 host attachment protein [Myxococcaceae bacterium]